MTDRQFVQKIYPGSYIEKCDKGYIQYYPEDKKIYLIRDKNDSWIGGYESTPKLCWKEVRKRIENNLIDKLSL